MDGLNFLEGANKTLVMNSAHKFLIMQLDYDKMILAKEKCDSYFYMKETLNILEEKNLDRKEKNARKAKLSEFVNFGNGRFKDYEIEELESIVQNRDNLDGASRTYRSSYKAFDSEDTYRVEEEDTYTFHSDGDGIHIERDFNRQWDDGQKDVSHEDYDTARDILNLVSKLFGKQGK